MISLDITNALNSIKWADFINLLKKYRTPGKLLKLFNCFLKDRTVILNNGDRWNYNIGVPQGSSCGPILWLLVANEALELFSEQENLLVQAFADDFVILLRALASYRFTELSNQKVFSVQPKHAESPMCPIERVECSNMGTEGTN
ncbi:hypothetical protein AVEN_73714-1 [Araneus ventricosus]|uniref:Reverse transcriptase domain-containing protein n=1 Tax=Araneus ventricosus TaxID=182803 RepID=A0A4Y2HQH4_ARAVE|nr:hypothetical protein AVEN_73714-1 [Araneus ventricosus]